MKKKEKPVFIFGRTNEILLAISLGLIITFFIIFIIAAIITKRVDFYSIFFHNIAKHIFLTILCGFHVGLLGFGILLTIIAFFNMAPEIQCYADRFEILIFLQKKKIIPYDKIDKITAKIYYLNYDNLIKGSPKKESRVHFYNKIYDFYICYSVSGYFDDIELFLKDDNEDLLHRCACKKENVVNLLKHIKLTASFAVPYLPEER